MFGLSDLEGAVGATLGLGRVLGAGEPPSGSAAAPIASPAPASAPPIRVPFKNVRRSTLLCCAASMRSISALILGPAMVVGLGLVAQPAVAGQTAPACAPAALDNSALQAGSLTVSPLAGSRDASPQTQISFLGAPVGDLGAISVVGSQTGVHSGRLAPYSQGDGASFL